MSRASEDSWRPLLAELTVAVEQAATEIPVLTVFLAERTGRWFFTGQGRSGLVAQMAAMRTMHLGRPTHVVGEATSPSIGPDDHLVAFSSSGATPTTIHLAQQAHDQGADVLGVVSRADSPLAALADATLLLPTGQSLQFGGSLFEQCALVIFDAAVLQISGQDPEVYAAMGHRHANLQ